MPVMMAPSPPSISMPVRSPNSSPSAPNPPPASSSSQVKASVISPPSMRSHTLPAPVR